MRTLAAVLLILLSVVTAFSQPVFYSECIETFQYGIVDIRVNAAGEICVLVRRSDINLLYSAYKFDNEGTQIWKKDFRGFPGKFIFDDAGDAYLSTSEYGEPSLIYKFFSTGDRISSIVAPGGFADYTTDNLGNIYVLNGTENASNWQLEYLWVTKYNTEGELEWGLKLVSSQKSIFSNTSIVSLGNGETLVSLLEQDPNDYTSFWFKATKVDADGFPVWNKIDNVEYDLDNRPRLTSSVYAYAGNLISVQSYDFNDYNTNYSRIIRIDAQSGNTVAETELNFKAQPKVEFGSNNIYLYGSMPGVLLL